MNYSEIKTEIQNLPLTWYPALLKEIVEAVRSHLLELPWVETSGHPASPYNYNNGIHAAVHSILAGMQCRKKKDVRYWLETAQCQLDDAVVAIKKPRAKVVPYRQNDSKLSHEHRK